MESSLIMMLNKSVVSAEVQVSELRTNKRLHFQKIVTYQFKCEQNQDSQLIYIMTRQRKPIEAVLKYLSFVIRWD
jgi:hypothetical protein